MKYFTIIGSWNKQSTTFNFNSNDWASFDNCEAFSTTDEKLATEKFNWLIQIEKETCPDYIKLVID